MTTLTWCTHYISEWAALLWQITGWLRWTGTSGSLWAHPCSSRDIWSRRMPMSKRRLCRLWAVYGTACHLHSHTAAPLLALSNYYFCEWPRCQYHFFKISLGNSAHCILTFITLTVQSCSIHLDSKFFPLNLVLAKHALLCWIIGSNDLRNIGSFL